MRAKQLWVQPPENRYSPVDSLTGLVRQLELDRPPRLLLPHCCAVYRIAVWCNVLDLDSYDIAAAKLAVDDQIKKGEVTYSPL